MAYLPTEEKANIQASYVRYRELMLEIPEVDKRVTWGQWAHWGGLFFVVVWAVRLFVGKELPDIVGGVALLSLVAGWAYKSDHVKKQTSLWSERQAIRKEMERLGVYFSDSLGRLNVYVGPIADENLVSPLSDSSYG